jgi:hypothetical protein
MGHANMGGQRRLWSITKQLTQGDTPSIITEQQHRTLTVEEAAVEIRQNPFPYDGLFVVLQDTFNNREYSLLIPENETLTPRLVSPNDSHGEKVVDIDLGDGPVLTGTTAEELGIPLR